MIDERQQGIQTEIIGGLHLLIHITTAIRDGIYPLEPGSVYRRREDTNANLGQELDEAFEHIVAVGVTVIVDVEVNHEARVTGNLV